MWRLASVPLAGARGSVTGVATVKERSRACGDTRLVPRKRHPSGSSSFDCYTISYPIVVTGSRIFRLVFRAVLGLAAVVLILGLAAPYVTPASYGDRLRYSLERALGR